MVVDLIKLLTAFLFTTVLGGALGYYFQTRTWRHQFRIRLLEAEQATATKLFEELSRLMDRRLYRMRQVHWKLKNKDTSREAVEEQMQHYRDVLCEWNDSLNRNLALTTAYFDSEIRRVLEGTVYEEFSRVGGALEERYKALQRGETGDEWIQTAEELTRELTSLGHHIYSLNLKMIRSLQDRQRGLTKADSTGLASKLLSVLRGWRRRREAAA